MAVKDLMGTDSLVQANYLELGFTEKLVNDKEFARLGENRV